MPWWAWLLIGFVGGIALCWAIAEWAFRGVFRPPW